MIFGFSNQIKVKQLPSTDLGEYAIKYFHFVDILYNP
jgi:hypothetical protein